jgi:hypothetical protein
MNRVSQLAFRAFAVGVIVVAAAVANPVDASAAGPPDGYPCNFCATGNTCADAGQYQSTCSIACGLPAMACYEAPWTITNQCPAGQIRIVCLAEE